MMSLITSIERLGFPFKTLDPFLFCVYHVDKYPAGDALMQVDESFYFYYRILN